MLPPGGTPFHLHLHQGAIELSQLCLTNPLPSRSCCKDQGESHMKTNVGMLGISLIISAITSLTVNNGVRADSVAIVGYDVEQVPQSGCGGWSYTYAGGTVVDTGRKMCCQPSGPPPGCSLDAAVPVLNFSGGT